MPASFVQPISFGTPTDYSSDLDAIQRRMALSQALQGQALEPAQGNGGPMSWTQGAAKLAQAWASKKQEARGQEQMRALSQRYQGDYANTVRHGLSQLQGTPGSEDAAGNWTPAQAADPAGAMATFGAHPQAAQLMPVALQEMQRQRLIEALKRQGGGAAQAQPAPPQQATQAPMQYAGGQFQSQPSPPPAPAAPPMPQQQQGSVGGPAGGIPMEAWIQADPSGKLYMEQLAKDRAPINMRPGGTAYVPGQGPMYTAPQNGIQTQHTPQGPVASPVQGYQQTQAGLTASTAAAQAGGHEYGRAPYTTQTVQTAPNPTLMTNQQAVEQATNRPMPLPYGMSGGQGGGAPQQPQGPAVGGVVPTMGGRGRGVGLPLQDQGAGAEQREVGKSLGQYYDTHMQRAAKASIANRYLDNMEIAAQGIKTGKLAPAQSTVIQWGQALGLPISQEAKNAAGDIATLNSMAIKMAGEATRQSDAQPSQLQFLKILEATPGAMQTEQGFRGIVGYMRDLNNYDIAKMQAVEAWRNDPRHGGSAAGFEAAWPAMAARMPFVWNQTKTQNLKDISAGGAQPQQEQRNIKWSDLGRAGKR